MTSGRKIVIRKVGTAPHPIARPSASARPSQMSLIREASRSNLISKFAQSARKRKTRELFVPS